MSARTNGLLVARVLSSSVVSAFGYCLECRKFNSPRFDIENFNLTSRLSGHFCEFAFVFFEPNVSSGNSVIRNRGKFAIFP